MMPTLYTQVAVPRLPFEIDFASGIVSIGSCFADEIGDQLRESDFHIEQNPFGTLYNPASIAMALQRIIDDREIDESDLVQHEGLWHSWHHHGSLSRPNAKDCMAVCNNRIHKAHQALKEASLLMVTFGTAWVFEHKGMVVANCHKLPPQEFVHRRMTVEEIVSLWTPLLQEFAAYYPQLNILFTVSPIRHMADGAHGNQLSKSTLLLAVDELVRCNNATTHYFPAYEIVLDELRDYRFYGPDMNHPAPLAVDVVWEHFQRATMAPALRDQAHYNMKQHKREKHIPIHQ
jgi:hypothetical protein